MRITNNMILFFSIILLFCSGYINTLYKKPFLTLSKQSSAININNFALNAFSIGQQRLISDFLWITTLIESDTEHYQKRDLSSWMYLRFNSIISLDPKFLQAYQFGGKYLNIVKDDLYGSEKIFEAGIKEYPNDYELWFNYAFLLGFELQNYKKAEVAYEKVLEFSEAPPYIKTLLAKIKFEHSADHELVLTLLTDLYQNEPDGTYLKKKLKKDIFSLQTQIDLNCLNSRENNHECNFKNPNGINYIKTSSGFQSPEDFAEYKLHTRDQ